MFEVASRSLLYQDSKSKGRTPISHRTALGINTVAKGGAEEKRNGPFICLSRNGFYPLFPLGASI